MWDDEFAPSELLRLETWNRVHAYGGASYRHQKARNIIHRVVFAEMSTDVFGRALTPFPIPVHTLDGLHLATAHHLRERGIAIRLASYDVRMLAVAEALGIPVIAI